MLIWLAALLALAGLIALGFTRKITILPAIGAFLASAATLLIASFATVPPGHVGVQVLFGAVQPKVLPEGLHAINPLAAVQPMSIRSQSYTMAAGESGGRAIVALSSDGLRMPMDASVVYRLDGLSADWVLSNIGPRYEEVILQPTIRTAIREAAARFTAQEAYASRREEMGEVMTATLREHVRRLLADRGLDGEGIIVQQVLLRNVDLPERVKNAIEEKLSADQESQRMDFVLAKERKEAERKEIEARGIQKFQEIVRQGIDEQLLRWKGIEATQALALSGNSKTIIIGGQDGLPLILNPR